MELYLYNIYRLLVSFNKHKDVDFHNVFKDYEIINLLLDMNLIYLKLNIFMDQSTFQKALYIKLTRKGELYIESFNLINFDNGNFDLK